MSIKRLMRLFWICLVSLSFFFMLSGCDGSDVISMPASVGDAGGGATRVLELPLALGSEHLCVQGAGGSYSHQGRSTRYDLDLDTSNVADEEVYAPAGGVIHVHDDSATSGFGYHVNIDLGDGTYVVIAHLSEIFVSDGDEVAAGQLIAYEGMTGYAQGDHIHLGLHRGDPSQDAAMGESVPVSYRVVDQTVRDGVQMIQSEDFDCGLRSAGDARDGHFYQSQLMVPMWHPDGTLVKTPDNARVYLLEDGRTRWIENESTFWAHNYAFSEVVLVSDEELACYGEGQDLNRSYAVDAFFDTEEQLWLVLGAEDSSARVRYRVRGLGWEQVMASWGLEYDTSNWPPTLGDTHIYMLNWEPLSTYIGLRDGTLVSEVDAPDLFVVSGQYALPVQNWAVYLMEGFFDREVLQVPDGMVGELHRVGDCAADYLCVDLPAITTCGGGLDLSDGESGGDPWEDPEDEPQDDDPDTGETGDADYDMGGDPDVGDCAGDDVCLADLDGDGLDESLLMIADQWLSMSAIDAPAYVYGNGGCFDGSLTRSDRVEANEYGYYVLDFSDHTRDCMVQMTLISEQGMSGSMDQWLWWQNAPFCSRGSDLCELMDNGTSWEEWLLAVRWDPVTGLDANGNGFTMKSPL
jgi:hypothetical protein